MYSYKAKNTGKDKIYYNRLAIADKLNININDCSTAMYIYILKAELGIILT